MKIIAYLHIPNDEFRYYHDYEHIHLFNYKFLLIVHFHFYSHKNRHWFLVLRSKFHCCKNRAWNFPVSLLAQLGEFFISNSNNHIILDIFPKFNCLGGPLSNWLYQSLIFFSAFRNPCSIGSRVSPWHCTSCVQHSVTAVCSAVLHTASYWQCAVNTLQANSAIFICAPSTFEDVDEQRRQSLGWDRCRNAYTVRKILALILKFYDYVISSKTQSLVIIDSSNGYLPWHRTITCINVHYKSVASPQFHSSIFMTKVICFTSFQVSLS